MRKLLKRTLALILAVMLCLGATPFSAFAAEIPSDNTISSEAPPSEAPEESSKPDERTDSSYIPEEYEPAPDPDEPTEPEENDTDAATEPTTEPESTDLAPGSELPITQIWPAPQRKARSASFGTNGTLYMGDECCPGGVGTPPTLGEYIGTMSVITMKYGGKHVAGYCLEHEKESGDGMGYTWMDLTTGNQETIGTILALGFQWNASGPYAARSDDSDKWLVTQVLVWETVAGNAFVQANGLIGIKAGVDDDMQMISAHAHNPTKFMQYYLDLKKRLNDYFKVPSFASKEASKANTIACKYVAVELSVWSTATDSAVAGADLVLLGKDNTELAKWTSERTAHRLIRVPQGEYALKITQNGQSDTIHFEVSRERSLQEVQAKTYLPGEVSEENKQTLSMKDYEHILPFAAGGLVLLAGLVIVLIIYRDSRKRSGGHR